MDKVGIRTSCHHYQYNGMHLEVKGWGSGKKCDECFSNIVMFMIVRPSICHFQESLLKNLTCEVLFSEQRMFFFLSWLISSFMLIFKLFISYSCVLADVKAS